MSDLSALQPATSALVAASHFLDMSPEAALIAHERVPEIKDAAISPRSEQTKPIRRRLDMVQFQALSCTLKIIRKENNKKLLEWFLNKNFRSQIAGSSRAHMPVLICSMLSLVLLLRLAAELLLHNHLEGENVEGRVTEEGRMVLREFMDLCLNHSQDIVAYEAANAICSLEPLTVGLEDPLTSHPAVAVMHSMSYSSAAKPAARRAASRSMAQLANRYLEK